MQPSDITGLIDVNEPRLSPDGETVAFAVTTIDADDNAYRSRVWLVAADGSSSARPFTSGEHRDTRPRWSPSGRSLAFVSHRDDKGSQLFVLPVGAGGEAVKLASSPEEIDALRWSPDGRWIAFTARSRDEERYGKDKAKDQPPRRITRLFARLEGTGWVVDRPRHLFVVPADASAAPVVLGGDRDLEVGGFDWFPDSDRLLVSSARHDTRDLDGAIDLWEVARAQDSWRQLTETGLEFTRPSVSPDGRIAFAMNDPRVAGEHTQICELEGMGPGFRVLTAELDRQCAPFVSGAREPLWVGDHVVFAAEDRGNVHLYRVHGGGLDNLEPVVTGERQVRAWDAAGGSLVVATSTTTRLTDLFAIEGAGERRLTWFGQAFAAKVPLVEPERFTATSADGAQVDAWMMAPLGFEEGRTYPALLNIHGGPFTQYGNGFFDEFQMQAAAGYVVLFANPRGSSGYPQSWGQAIRGPAMGGSGWGGVDYDDLMAVVDTAIERFGFIDADRVGVMGGSYGGYMTTWMVGHTDRFVAGCSERAANNLFALEYGSDVASVFRSWIGVSHLDDPEEYRRQSPVTYIDNITTPLLIVHSEEDWRCPIAQADELFVALRLRGQEVEMLRFPGEGHELSRSGSPRHRQQRMEAILEWFGRYLKT